MYEKILQPILFKFDPERMHILFVRIGKILGATRTGRFLIGLFCEFEHPALKTKVRGIDFKNPIGLAAGFDKDVEITKITSSVGFGFLEVGAITRYPYKGNPKPRAVRLLADQSLVISYGLKNRGAEEIEKRLRKLKFSVPVGINIAKTNDPKIKGSESIEDYLATYRTLSKYFAYVTLNVSCPNAGDGCLFQDPSMLLKLLDAFSRESKTCPIFLKISSHLTEKELDEILLVVEKYPFVDGFVVGNLAKRRDLLNLISPREKLDLIPSGGISGRPIKELTTKMIRHIYRKTGGKYTIIGLGGIFTAEDAYEKIKAGASLVQVITGLIYRGPTVVKKINKGLVELFTRDGYKTIGEAVGKEVD